MKKFLLSLSSLMGYLLLTSCSAPIYLPGPEFEYQTIENTFTFGVQNMDESAKVETEKLTCHYNGFDVTYKLESDLVISLVITNNTNKSLIIDKSKCYVLYDGYATQLFKDVRSSRSTTFNNVQDAINNVQTNESGVSMTIPPYSKWDLPIAETNIRGLKRSPKFREEVGLKSLTPFDENQELIEFVIPWTYDYALAKWNTCRNRIYINSIEVKKQILDYMERDRVWLTANSIKMLRSYLPDYSEANRIDAINMQIYKKHLKKVRISHYTWGSIFLLPTLGISALAYDCEDCNHMPPKYGVKNYR